MRLRVDARYKCLALEELKALAEIDRVNVGSMRTKSADVIEVDFRISPAVLCRATMVREVDGVKTVRHVRSWRGRLIDESPTSLPPLVARAMVNLARVRKGDVVYEPFCGRGSIALEAAVVGAEVYCSDVDSGAIRSCLKNMPVNAEVHPFVADARHAPLRRVEFTAVVTDLPYGKLSACKYDVEGLYWNFVVEVDGLLRRGSYVVLAYPNYAAGIRELFEDLGFDVVNECPMYIHSGLYRIIGIYKKR